MSDRRAFIGPLGEMGTDFEQLIHVPKPVHLVQMDFVQDGQLHVIPFFAPTPDARVQLRVSLFAVPAPASAQEIPWDFTAGDQLALSWWMAAAVNDEATGKDIPVTNLVGTRNTPQIIDTGDGSVCGASETILTDADLVMGEVTFAYAPDESGGTSLNLYLSWRYQPLAGALISPREWQRIVTSCNPRVPGNLPIIISGA